MATTDVKTSINETDYRVVAESIHAEYCARAERRKHLAKHWEEIDRQLRMEPELSHKMGIKNNRLSRDPSRGWMPEVELPLQAGALETLLSDVRRLRYPSNRDWFTARAALTPQYIQAFAKAGNPFVGEKARTIVDVSQDDADKLVQGHLSDLHSYYDFRGFMDLVDAQALCYGTGVGRMRRVKHRALGYNARTTQPKELESPMMIPRDIKKTFLDDSQHSLMHEGFALGPATLQERTLKLVDLKAAADGNDDYLKSEIAKLKPDKAGNVRLVELEGDWAFDRGAETVIVQDVCLTIAFDGKAPQLVKTENGEQYSTYIVHQYHLEGPQYAYASAPLLKGMPIAKAAAQALNRVIESGLLKSLPPISHSPDDPYFAANGPVIQPRAIWKSADGVDVHSEVGGDPQVLFAIFSGLVSMYADVTGVTPARMGAETKSHTTAFAKDVEVNRGTVRTVDYVQSTMHNQMTRLLNLEYRMSLDSWTGNSQRVTYIEDWNEFVQIGKGHLPDIVRLIAIGSDAPAEEQTRVAEKLQAAQAALQVDLYGQQTGKEPVIQSVKPMIEAILREGGWQSLEELFTQMGATPSTIEQLPGLLYSNPAAVQ